MLLFRYFLRQFILDDQLPTIDEGVFEALGRYRWPGNVRELQNVAGRVAAFAQGPRITRADLPPKLLQTAESEQSVEAQSLEALERDAIIRALASTGGNRKRAAEQLNIGLATLYRKIKKFNIS